MDACLAALLDRRVPVAVRNGGRFHQRIPFASGPRELRQHLVWFLLSGRASGAFAGRHAELRPGALLWVTPGTPHDAVIETGSSLVGLRIDIGSTRIQRRATLLTDAWEARPLLEQAVSELGRHDRYAAERLRALLAAVRGLLLREPDEPRAGPLSDAQRQAVQALAARRLGHGLAIADLAAAARLSRDYFARAFRRTYGVPPRQWLLLERLRAARALLERTTLPVKEIARTVGIADANLLARQFRRAYGHSPRAFRRERASGP